MVPLAERLRPTDLTNFIGQQHLVGINGPIFNFLQTHTLPSMIFWGPPASGKTTLARILGAQIEAEFLSLSAVMDGKEEFKKILVTAERNFAHGQNTIIFIDEIHRWNKAQQDALLPYVEKGTLILIGATTENPSFTVNSALLSRCRVMIFNSLSVEEILTGLLRAWAQLHPDLLPPQKQLLEIAQLSDGDIRYALTTLEIANQLGNGQLRPEIIQNSAQKALSFDKSGEQHYNLISAVHKSLRSSNPTAATYWIMRMLDGGEDPLYIARRLLRFASEDIGNENPNALLLANQVFDACHKLGMPECETALVQLAEYLAKSPKNNSAYRAVKMAKADIKKYGSLPVPMHLRNAPTQLMREIGYGRGYEYDHDLPDKKSQQQTMPDKLADQNYFET